MIRTLVVLLSLSALLDVVLGVWAGAFWPSYVRQWLPSIRDAGLYGPPPRPPGPGGTAGEIRLLGLVLGLCLLCFAALQGLALAWIRRGRGEAYSIVLLFGFWLIASSTVIFAVFRHPAFLLIDGMRGAVLIVATIFALRAPTTVRELRLPEPKRADRAGRSGQRRAEREGDRSRSGVEGPRAQRRGSERGEDDRGRRGRRVSSPPPGGDPRADGARDAGRERGASPDRPLAVVVRGARGAPGDGAAGGGEGRAASGRRRRRGPRRAGGSSERGRQGLGDQDASGGSPERPTSPVEALDRLSRLDPDHRPAGDAGSGRSRRGRRRPAGRGDDRG